MLLQPTVHFSSGTFLRSFSNELDIRCDVPASQIKNWIENIRRTLKCRIGMIKFCLELKIRKTGLDCKSARFYCVFKRTKFLFLRIGRMVNYIKFSWILDMFSIALKTQWSFLVDRRLINWAMILHFTRPALLFTGISQSILPWLVIVKTTSSSPRSDSWICIGTL